MCAWLKESLNFEQIIWHRRWMSGFVAETMELPGFVAQMGLRSNFPLPQTELPYGLGAGYAKCCEAV